MTLRRSCPALLVAGLTLMLPFESTITRIGGIGCLVAFIVCGLFCIATPAFLDPDE